MRFNDADVVSTFAGFCLVFGVQQSVVRRVAEYQMASMARALCHSLDFFPSLPFLPPPLQECVLESGTIVISMLCVVVSRHVSKRQQRQ